MGSLFFIFLRLAVFWGEEPFGLFFTLSTPSIHDATEAATPEIGRILNRKGDGGLISARAPRAASIKQSGWKKKTCNMFPLFLRALMHGRGLKNEKANTGLQRA